MRIFANVRSLAVQLEVEGQARIYRRHLYSLASVNASFNSRISAAG
jgi:hypothetical protein